MSLDSGDGARAMLKVAEICVLRRRARRVSRMRLIFALVVVVVNLKFRRFLYLHM